MQSLFDPVINEIIQLISKQEQMAWNDKREKIEVCVPTDAIGAQTH